MERLIKKYKNRRLYDTETSQYITVEDLQRYVMEGILFRVVDSSSHADLTNGTLLQIFVEMESSTSRFLSADMLRHLIIIAQHPMNTMFKDMLEQMFAATRQQPLNRDYLEDYNRMANDWQKNMQEMAAQWQNFYKPRNK